MHSAHRSPLLQKRTLHTVVPLAAGVVHPSSCRLTTAQSHCRQLFKITAELLDVAVKETHILWEYVSNLNRHTHYQKWEWSEHLVRRKHTLFYFLNVYITRWFFYPRCLQINKVCYITADPLPNKPFKKKMFSSFLHKHLVVLLYSYSYMVIKLKMQRCTFQCRDLSFRFDFLTTEPFFHLTNKQYCP